MNKLIMAAGLSTLATVTSVANAHVSFVANNAYAGKSYIATATIPHGCEDENGEGYDTSKIEMTIPAGFTNVRPADAAFGPASVVKDEAGNVTKLIWTKTALPAVGDDLLYQVTFRGTLPADALQTLKFDTLQTCAGDKTKAWEGADAPSLKVLPARTTGWNKYTAQSALDETAIKSYFADAQIVWSNGAAYSANSVTNGLITNKLTAIAQGAEYWVKY